MLRLFNNGVRAVTFGRISNVFVGVGEHVQVRWFVRVSLARTPLAIRISLQMTRPPNYPGKVPKRASRNLAEDLTVRKERDFTLG